MNFPVGLPRSEGRVPPVHLRRARSDPPGRKLRRAFPRPPGSATRGPIPDADCFVIGGCQDHHAPHAQGDVVYESSVSLLDGWATRRELPNLDAVVVTRPSPNGRWRLDGSWSPSLAMGSPGASHRPTVQGSDLKVAS